MKSSEVLIQAKSLIESPDNWVQGVYSKNSEDRVVHFLAPDACKFCSLGAIARVEKYDYTPAKNYLEKVMNKSVIEYNDEFEHEDVKQAFDKAIELAKQNGD